MSRDRGMDLVLRRVRVRDDQPLVDIGMADGRIAAIAECLPDKAAEQIDGGGHVVIPGLVETHLHLDKALLAERRPNRSGTLAEAIRITGEQKQEFTPEDVRTRAEAALRMVLRHGTTAIRAETEFDPVVGLLGVKELLRLKERYAPLVDIQVVAFPQEGVHQTPGTEELFWEAMELGADVVGGIPYNDLDAEKHIDLCFEIARTYDKPISLHQDFRDDADALSIEYVAHKTIAEGWQGRVELGHATALGAVEPRRLSRILDLLRAADISVVPLPATDLHLGGRGDAYNVRRGLAPVRALLEAGVNVAVSSNNIRNAYTPFGNGDLLVIANLLIAAAHLGGAETLPRVLDMVTINAARAIGIGSRYGLQVGRPADLVVLQTQRVRDAVIDIPERLWVVKDGRVTVVNRLVTEFRRGPRGSSGTEAPDPPARARLATPEARPR